MSEELNRIYKYVDGHKRVRKENSSGDETIDKSEKRNYMKILAIIVNIFLPGFGTLIVKKFVQGIMQILLSIFAVFLIVTGIGAIIGFPLYLIVLIWAIISSVQSPDNLGTGKNEVIETKKKRLSAEKIQANLEKIGDIPEKYKRNLRYKYNSKRYVTSFVVVLCIGLAILDRGLIPPDLGHTLFEKWFGKWFGMSLEVFLQSLQYTVENLEEKRLWVPLSSSLIHEWSPEQYKLFHGIRLLFNLFWFWVLGGMIEKRIGNTEWLLLISLLAMVASGVQYLTYPLPAVGLSGVIYGCFGYMWVQRRRVSEYAGILSSFNVFILISWLFLSLVLSQAGLYGEVTNIAHMTGLLFGVVIGYMFSRKWLVKIFVYLVIIFMMAIALVPLIYSSGEINTFSEEINTFVHQLEQRWNKCCSQAWK